ncbi:MAG: NnrU family protein [Rhodospirillales bacterium]|jgi:uncharacterized membrane protein|nr:NnrU family protein [Rhodospirillales bacterium]
MIWFGIGLFFGLHFIPSLPNVRKRLIGRMGENAYKGAYSLIAFIGLILIGVGYTRMEYQELWTSPIWASHLTLTVMPIVFILQVAAELKGHIRKTLKHPMMLGVLLWALVHLVSNGDRASLYLFGSFALFSLFSIISSIRRGKLPDYNSAKSMHDFIAVGIGVVLFAAVLWGHEFLFGVAATY